MQARAQALDVEDSTRLDEAVVAARDGRFAQSLSTLEELARTYPDELRVRHDFATVLAWSGNNARAVEIATPLEPIEAPRYVQLAVAKSARDSQQFNFAARWYDAAIANDADDRDALLGRLLTAGDAVDATTVRRLIKDLDARGMQGTDVALAKGYSLNAIADPLAALAAYDAALAEDPANREGLRGKALALRSLLLPTHALELEAANPGILTPAEIDRLKADEAAVNFRLTARTPYLPGSQDERHDEALNLIDQRLAETTQAASRRSLLFDRVVALNEANDSEAAIATFESIPDRHQIEQPYVLVAAASSYQRAKRPEEALILIDRAIDLAPENIDYRLTRVYALLDLERYDEALIVAQELAANLPRLNQVPGSNVVKGNDAWLRAELVAGIAESYGDQLDAAQARFEAVLSQAPNNSEFRNELANIYRWRGWLDRSMAEYQRVLTMEDEVLNARLGFAHSRIDARDYPEAAAEIEDLTATFTRNPSVSELAERWRIHNEREIEIVAASGESSGPIAGSDSYTINGRWYTAPLAYRYRALVTTFDGHAEFPEGEARRRRIGAGVEYRSRRFVLTGIVSANRSGGGDVGISSEASHRISDFWSLGAGVEWNTNNVQLRAHRLGLEADRAFIDARFAPNELSSVGFGLSRFDYSDDNVQESLYANGRRRVLNRPRSKLDATGSIAFGRASYALSPYFNPADDRSFMVGLEHQFRLYRRYERGLTQTVSVGSGRYYQAGFAGGSIWSVTYRVDLAVSPSLSVGLGAERHGQLFDGLREHTSVATVSVLGRF